MIREIHYYKYFDGQGQSKVRGYKFERYGTTIVQLKTIFLKGGEKKVVLVNEEEGTIKNAFVPKIKGTLTAITENEYNALDVSGEEKESTLYREKVDKGIAANLEAFFHERAALTGAQRLKEYSEGRKIPMATEAETLATKASLSKVK